VRTTLTLDDDVAAKLEAEARRTGASFKQVVNDCLRLGFSLRRELKKQAPFVVHARALELRAGLTYEDIGELLEQVEGPRHR
jgi:Ribbon-helix-helix protein, copG family